jgi:hypothetical protein
MHCICGFCENDDLLMLIDLRISLDMRDPFGKYRGHTRDSVRSLPRAHTTTKSSFGVRWDTMTGRKFMSLLATRCQVRFATSCHASNAHQPTLTRRSSILCIALDNRLVVLLVCTSQLNCLGTTRVWSCPGLWQLRRLDLDPLGGRRYVHACKQERTNAQTANGLATACTPWIVPTVL